MSTTSITTTLRHLFFTATLGILGTLGGVATAQEQPLGTTAAMSTEENEVLSTVISSHTKVRSSQTFNLAWQVYLADGWHIYYSNPGDSGLPPTLTLGEGFTAGPLTFPTPHIIRIPPITNYGYEDKVVFTTQVTAPATLQADTPVSIPVKLTFLFCKDICLPGMVETTLTLNTGLTPDENPAYGPVVAQQQAALPQAVPANVMVHARKSNDRILLSWPTSLNRLDEKTTASPHSTHFIPNADGMIDDGAEQDVSTDANNTYALIGIKPDTQATSPTTVLDGLLVISPNRSYRIQVPIQPEGDIAPSTSPAKAGDAGLGGAGSTGGGSLVVALVSAFLAGLILNLMPCVLPVLALKVLGVVKGHHGGKAWHHSAGYTAGILVTFAAFAIALAILKQAGSSVGWGFHLQSPYVTGGLAALMLALALNLFGVFEAGTSLTRLALTSPVKTNNHVREAFITGLLAVIVATPCTVPFMGGAMAYALTEANLFTSLLTFLTLGLGMAAPFILLTSLPALVRYIPKPGPWMVTFKQVLGWPMLATGVWLVWVCGNQTSSTTQLFVMLWLMAFAASLWWYGQKTGWVRLVPVALALAGLFYALTPAPQQPESHTWQRWSPEITTTARGQGPVFVDFTADWCLTCKVTEATVLNTPQTLELFAKSGTTLLKADWTKQDPQITAELAKHGRKGVPLYLLYLPGSEAEILPQLVTHSLLESKLSPYVK